jgi:hypothetical protein
MSGTCMGTVIESGETPGIEGKVRSERRSSSGREAREREMNEEKGIRAGDEKGVLIALLPLLLPSRFLYH